MKDVEENLPLYVNDRLSPEERTAVAEAIANDKGLEEDAKFLAGLRMSLQADEQPTPGELGLARLKRSLAAEKQQAAPQRPAQRSFWRSLALAACAILGLQSAFLINQQLPDTGAGVTTLSQTRLIEGPVIQLVFTDEMTAGQIRTLLTEIDGDLISGPGALGVYEVELPENADLDSLISQLSVREGVEQVSRP